VSAATSRFAGSPETEIKFFASQRTPVKIIIVDPLGRLVRVLFDGVAEAGEHRTRWNGKDANAAAAASGIYFVSMRSEGFIAVRKLLLLR
jgi:flagellar hook assembly protein FlgD